MDSLDDHVAHALYELMDNQVGVHPQQLPSAPQITGLHRCQEWLAWLMLLLVW